MSATVVFLTGLVLLGIGIAKAEGDTIAGFVVVVVGGVLVIIGATT